MLYTVTLDPGHGGHDPGALGPSGLRESDMALDVCRRAKKLLAPFVAVVMTRDGDVYLPLSERAEIANRAGSNAFVSYHFNSATSKNTAPSWEIFTTPGQNNSDILADEIGYRHAELFPNQQARTDTQDGDLDKEANFSVIRNADCPAVLMEGEFIHTEHGERFIANEHNRQKMALAVADGVLRFLGVDATKAAPHQSIENRTLEQRVERIEAYLHL